MDLFKAIILGIVQGLTEFLPISSSGHLVLVGELMDVEMSAMFTIAVHVGTLFSVLIYYRKELWELVVGLFQKGMNEAKWIILFLIIGTIPAVVLGLAFEDFFRDALKNEILAAAMLLITGTLLLLPGWLSKRKGEATGDMTMKRAIWMGLGQAFAILPGISRSGSTIAAGMLAGVEPKKAANFAFLLAIPVIAGGAVFEFKDIERIPEGVLTGCIVGAIFAFGSGIFAIYAVLDTIRRGKFQYFAFYCYGVGILALIYFGLIKKPGESIPATGPEAAQVVPGIPDLTDSPQNHHLSEALKSSNLG